MKHCDLVKDLLPLYAENLLSEESRSVVADHLASCPDCRALMQKMDKEITVRADNDIAVMQRIRKRIRIEKIGIAAAVILFALILLWVLCITMVGTTSRMDYAAYNLAENVTVEEDDAGDLWLVLQNEATSADLCMPTVRDSSGNHMGYNEGFSAADKEAYGFTLEHARIYDVIHITMMMPHPQKMLLFNKDDKPEIQEIFYYDADNDTEYVLWERN